MSLCEEIQHSVSYEDVRAPHGGHVQDTQATSRMIQGTVAKNLNAKEE